MRHRAMVLVAAASAAVASLTATGLLPRAVGAATQAPSAAAVCPPYSFPNTTNLAVNPSFETVGPNGTPTVWHAGDPTPPPSAAAGWYMHTSNQSDTVASALIATTVPGPGGSKMLHFKAGGNEGGIVQQLAGSPAYLMFSAWVWVNTGHVAMQANGGTTGPSAWNTKLRQWEELRVCTDGTVPTGYFVIENEDPTGGDFYVDRVEVREMNPPPPTA